MMPDLRTTESTEVTLCQIWPNVAERQKGHANLFEDFIHVAEIEIGRFRFLGSVEEDTPLRFLDSPEQLKKNLQDQRAHLGVTPLRGQQPELKQFGEFGNSCGWQALDVEKGPADQRHPGGTSWDDDAGRNARVNGHARLHLCQNIRCRHSLNSDHQPDQLLETAAFVRNKSRLDATEKFNRVFRSW